VLFALAVIIRIFYTLNVKLPSLPKVSMEQYEKPSSIRTPERNEGKPFLTRESKITSDAELLQKVKKATGTVEDGTTKTSNLPSGSLLKDMLRKKIEGKLNPSSSTP
jgi:hypothetical protein